MRQASRTVFGQLALVIALVLVGASALAVLLGREFAARPATEQLLRTIDALAEAVERADRAGNGASARDLLREGGLEVSTEPPQAETGRFAPFLRRIEQRARRAFDAREVVAGHGPRGGVLWLKLETVQPLWVAFAYQNPRTGVRRYSVLLLAGCAVLVWLAAAYCARRLGRPLKLLARAAPALVRGEEVELATAGAPREVGELAASLAHAGAGVREAAAERALMLAGISHDLRTPLTRLQYALALVPGTDPALRAGMERDIAEIDAILSQFIAYARDGRDEASEPLDLAALCRTAAAADAGWQVHAPAYAPMRGKPMALWRAAENLVANAQRHGAPPYVLALAREGDAWRIDVDDGGDGLPEAERARALRPFVHGGAQAGSGLGLAIVDRVARQHGGELRLSANVPRGLRATLLLRGA